jgi:peptidoglycan-N-acetylglucosamine deacetylase
LPAAFSILRVRRSWNWDFEEEPRTRARRDRAAAGEPVRAPVPVATVATPVELRRRRVALALVAALILLAVIVAVLGSQHGGPRTRASAVASATAAAGTPGAGSLRQAGDPVKSVLAYTPFVTAGGVNGRDVALTFDDGPGPYTPEILSVLERERVQATFFAIGKMERYFSVSTRRAVSDGDVVGDHTESHLPLATLSAQNQHEQLFEGIARVELAGGPRPELFRPPYGSFNATTLRELHGLGLLMVLWSVDTRDYQQPGIPAIVERALAGARPGAIVLMHDGGGNRAQTIAALPTIIRDLRARGYKLVTIPQLLRDDPPPAGQPIPPSLAGD